MSRLKSARERLETAMARVESLAHDAAGGDQGDLSEQLDAVRADYAALEDVTDTVRAQLDATIERLETILKG